MARIDLLTSEFGGSGDGQVCRPPRHGPWTTVRVNILRNEFREDDDEDN